MTIKEIRDIIQAYKYNNIVERKAIKELLGLHSVSNWVEASEPPTVNHFYLVYDKESGAITKALYNNGEWHTVEKGFDENITHWKDLPKPPYC